MNLSSAGRRFADIDLEDPDYENSPYDEFEAYGRAKTANVLFAVEFDRRHCDRGVRAAAVHPGGIQTELARHMTPEVIQRLMARVLSDQSADAASYPWKSVPQDAATSVWTAVVAPADAIGGRYCEDCHVAEVVDDARSGVRAYALDPARAAALWAGSEQLVGESFQGLRRLPGCRMHTSSR